MKQDQWTKIEEIQTLENYKSPEENATTIEFKKRGKSYNIKEQNIEVARKIESWPNMSVLRKTGMKLLESITKMQKEFKKIF